MIDYMSESENEWGDEYEHKISTNSEKGKICMCDNYTQAWNGVR